MQNTKTSSSSSNYIFLLSARCHIDEWECLFCKPKHHHHQNHHLSLLYVIIIIYNLCALEYVAVLQRCLHRVFLITVTLSIYKQEIRKRWKEKCSNESEEEANVVVQCITHSRKLLVPNPRWRGTPMHWQVSLSVHTRHRECICRGGKSDIHHNVNSHQNWGSQRQTNTQQARGDRDTACTHKPCYGPI